MAHQPDQPRVAIQVALATPEQQPILANLLELYAHDFSEFHPIALGPDGRFGYKSLEEYWSLPDRHAFLFAVDGNLAGLALIKKGSEITRDPSVWDGREFFVLRSFRKRGVGSAAAHEIWRKYEGPWEVRVMKSNVSALSFWQRATSTFTRNPVEPAKIEKDGQHWNVFSFESKRADNK
jgi:predicted acetyltransferase